MSNTTNNGRAQPKTSDFIGFSVDTQGSPSNRFTPANYSSPQGNQQQPYFSNNRQWNNKNFNNSYQNNRNSYNNYSPNRSFNRSYNRSQNSSFNQSQNRSFNNYGHNKAKQDHNNTFNKQLFMHPSFMENPWAQLEAKLKQSMNIEELPQD